MEPESNSMNLFYQDAMRKERNTADQEKQEFHALGWFSISVNTTCRKKDSFGMKSAKNHLLVGSTSACYKNSGDSMVEGTGFKNTHTFRNQCTLSASNKLLFLVSD